MTCPFCDGDGGYTEMIDPEIGGPHYDCEMCNKSGKVSLYRWLWWHYYRIRDEHRLHRAQRRHDRKEKGK